LPHPLPPRVGARGRVVRLEQGVGYGLWVGLEKMVHGVLDGRRVVVDDVRAVRERVGWRSVMRTMEGKREAVWMDRFGNDKCMYRLM
jgi:hypothetical protein